MIRALAVSLSLVFLTACATPLVQGPMATPAAFTGPRLEEDAFVSFDGARLAVKQWHAEGREPWAVIVALHGLNDYSNGWHLAAPVWAQAARTCRCAFSASAAARTPPTWRSDATSRSCFAATEG